MLYGLDLFSGIGGLSIALKEWIRPIAYCEIDPYCQGVLLSRMADLEIYNAPIWDDILCLQSGCFNQHIDIIYGGFPCQDISIAGHGKGLEGKRSGLFFEIMRLCREIRPTFIYLENVPAITSRGGQRVVGEITALGYDCRWCIISAASIGALHRRERWFLLGYSKHNGLHGTEKRGSIETPIYPCEERKDETGEFKRTGTSPMLASESFSYSNSTSQRRLSERTSSQKSSFSKLCADVADTICKRLEGQWDRTSSTSEEKPMSSGSSNDGNTNGISSEQTDTRSKSEPATGEAWRRFTGQYWPYESREHWQEAVSTVCRTSNGVYGQLDRIRGLGNAVVPQQAKEAFKILMGLK